MSENRFAGCQEPKSVLWEWRRVIDIGPIPISLDEQDMLESAALARIRELTPPTVSEEARERAKSVVYAAMMEAERLGPDVPAAHRWLDRIIDALGYTPAPPKLICTCGEFETIVCEEHPAPASPPVVELDQADLETLARLLASWSDLALHLGVDVSHRLPIGYGDIRQRDDDGAWVLRIGGDQ